MFYFDYSYFTTIIDFLNDKLFPCLIILIFIASLSLTLNIVRWFTHK